MTIRALVAAAMLSIPTLAAAAPSPRPANDCTISVRPDQTTWTISGYDPFGSGAAEGVFAVHFTNSGSTACSFNPVFELSSPPFGLARGNNNGHRIDYTLVDLTSGVDVTPTPSRPRPDTRFDQITLDPNETESRLFRFAIDTGSITRDGTFSQDVMVGAQDGRFTAVGSAPVVLLFNVQPSARMSLAGSYSRRDGRAVVDIGELRPGRAPVVLQLNVSSTSAYDLTVSSRNQGRLRLASSDWTIPYSLAIGGHPIDLSGTAILPMPDRAGFRIDRLPIDIIVGGVESRRAGTYSDVISISVAAR